MLGLLPFCTLLSATIFLAVRFPAWSWRNAFLRASIGCGVYLAATTELLSHFDGLTQISLLLAWIVPSGVLIYWTAASWTNRPRPVLELQGDKLSILMLAGVCIILIGVGINAVVAPPNTYDAMTYHMSRVAHWAQNETVKPYATGILRQLFLSPGSEFAMLHTYVLSGGDRLVNLVQWFAMTVSVVAVSVIARDLGGNARAQSFAALFAATLPAGIAQAATAMADYAVAMWIAIAAVEVAAVLKSRGLRWSNGALMAAAAGLAILTKPTAFPYLLPLGILAGAKVIETRKPVRIISAALIAISIVLIINAGYFARNMRVFRRPLDDGSHTALYRNEVTSWQMVVSNVLRNASLHAGTPLPELNDLLFTALAKLHVKMGIGLEDPRTSVEPFFVIWEYPADEVRSSNTLQALLILISFPALAVKRKSIRTGVLNLASAAVLGFLIFSLAFKFYILGGRFHLSFFLLAAPVVAIVLDRFTNQGVLLAVAAVLLIGSVPILLRVGSRPLIDTENAESVFAADRTQLYFAQAPQLDEPYREMADLVEERNCNQVGLMLAGDAPEYPLWVLLGAPSEELWIEWIIARSDPSGSYRSEDFSPCAMVCGACPTGWTEFRGLPLIYDNYGHRLFLRSGLGD